MPPTYLALESARFSAFAADVTPKLSTRSQWLALLKRLVAAGAAGVAYTYRPAFASQIDAGANAVYVKASEIAALAP